MILIGRGLDLGEKGTGIREQGLGETEGNGGKPKETEVEPKTGTKARTREDSWKRRMSEQSDLKPWSGQRARSEGEDGDIRTNLCGFEGAKPELRAEAKRRKAASPNISGDNSLRDPPVPIPNTEVKPQHADSTWLETAR